MHPPPADETLTLAELGIKPGSAVESARVGPVRILAEGTVVAYLLSAEHYDMLRDAVGKAALAELMLRRHGDIMADDDEVY